MSDDGQPLDRGDYRLMSNAGRCDICGKPIDMSSGDTLTMTEFGIDEDIEGITDQDAADGVARALEQIGETGADFELAEVIREKQAMKVHESCLEETCFDQLTVDAETAEEVTDA